MPEIASKFLFTSAHCELPDQLPLLISLRSGIKSQSIVETIFLTFYGRTCYEKSKILSLYGAFMHRFFLRLVQTEILTEVPVAMTAILFLNTCFPMWETSRI